MGVTFKIHKEIKKPDINKPNNAIEKWSTDQNREFFFNRRTSSCQETFKKMITVLNLQGKARQNNSEIPSYTCQNKTQVLLMLEKV